MAESTSQIPGDQMIPFEIHVRLDRQTNDLMITGIWKIDDKHLSSDLPNWTNEAVVMLEEAFGRRVK